MDSPKDPCRTGCVYLVGAGPGDPGLITVRGMRLLESADVVVFDYLANPQLLKYCPTAETIYVGKQASRHSMTQADINQLLVARAKDGNRVVRLKGGDPFVFGRGGEEAEALHAAGISFEVVPGITAAIGGPAYAGIPVTHRDANSSFTLITGHEKEADYQDSEAKTRKKGDASDLDYAALAKLPCLCFYMGVKSLPSICKKLIDHGMRPDMPAASIQWSTTPKQRTITGTISDLPQKIAEAKLTPPVITIIGPNVSLRSTLNWFETRPLFGKTVVVTRTRHQQSDLADRLEHLGARVIEAPTLELSPPSDFTDIDHALRNLSHYDWIIFTSANGVIATRNRLADLSLDSRAFAKSKVAVVGDATASSVRDHLNLRPDLIPQTFAAEGLAAALAQQNEIKGKKFLLLRADIARPVLVEKLREAGASEIRDISVYESRPVSSLPPALLEALKNKQVHWLTFTSSSTARNLVTLLGPTYRKQLETIRIASIGPITTATLNELGLPPTVQVDASNIDSLVEAIRSTSA